MKTSAVVGKVKAQYIQNLPDTMLSSSHRRVGTAKSAAKKVAGRKTMVMTAMIFIAELSLEAALASWMLANTSPRLTMLKILNERQFQLNKYIGI